jgi:hypothetical protein
VGGGIVAGNPRPAIRLKKGKGKLVPCFQRECFCPRPWVAATVTALPSS